jgi:hypothetical protein
MDIPKRRGRPTTGGRQQGVMVRAAPSLLLLLDVWIAAQPGKMTRPEAIRTILKTYLSEDVLGRKDAGRK